MGSKGSKKGLPPNGPVQSGECCRCGVRRNFDIYWHECLILCGDCRYKEIHGVYARKENGGGHSLVRPSRSYENSEDVGLGSETLGRGIEMNAVTPRHAEFLNQWLDESTLSLD